ncbi:MAG: PAS domain-containing protein [Candidatus Rokuibacteriota bacterium]
MAQKAVEIILMRQLASYLAVPIFLVDPEGNLLYYNEPAERLLGRRYDETGEMPLATWSTAFTPTAEDGSPLAPEDLPLSIALQKRRAAHRAMAIQGLDGVPRRIAVTAFPLEGQGERHLGAVAIFWEERPG